MSLVNDMLRDLDRRRRLPIQAHRVGRFIDITDDISRPRAFYLALLVVTSLAAGLAGGYFLMQRSGGEADNLVFPTAAPAVESLPPVAVAEPESPPLPALRSLEVAEVIQTDKDFTLRLRGSERLDYSITDRNSNGMTLRFEKLDAYHDSAEPVSGLSVIQMPQYTLLELELPGDADMKLYEAEASDAFELVLSARYREPAAVPSSDAARIPEAAVVASAGTPPALSGVMGLPSTPSGASEPQRRALDSERLPLRVTRGLTLEQQDRNTSQSAVALVQSGRLLEAYDKLLTFLARNPEAHVSRETLGTILLAQREPQQAAQVVDEGLQLAPNYAPYKKIKARLLLQEGRAAEALRLMEQVPPLLAEDKEYHELLATLYQQNAEHGKAIAAYQQLLRLNSAEGRWWTGLGISLEAQGDSQQAVASYQAALQQGNIDPGVRQYSQERIRSLGRQ